MPEFVYFIRAAREGFATASTPEEDAAMGAHFRYLQGLVADGTALLAGPCLDASVGIVIFRAPDEAAAEAIMRADPSVQQGVMNAELKPFRVSLLANDWPRENP